MTDRPKSFLESEVHQSILFPPLVFGMPRKLFLLIAITTLALVMSLGQFWFLAVTVVLLIIGRRISREDRYVFEVYTQLAKLPDKLD